MLLDARGHLKLTDLGLCKKIGDVSPHEEPEAILEMLRRQTISGNSDDKDAASDGLAHLDTKPLAEENVSEDTPKRDAKTRREVSFSATVFDTGLNLLKFSFVRWLIQQSVHRTT